MIGNTIDEICIRLESADIQDFEKLPNWCEMIGSYDFAQTVDNKIDALPYLQNMIDYFPYAKYELQETLQDTPHWSTIANLFNTLRTALEAEYSRISQLSPETKVSRGRSFFSANEGSEENTEQNNTSTPPEI